MHTYLQFSLIIPALLISACSTNPPVTENNYIMPSSLNSSPVQSPNDTRQYQYFTLKNKLHVLIISDPNTDKAAASLDVFVGSANDPKDRAGLAHFLEHMLFLGTEKYPDPDEYQSFISQHGGSRNAYTAREHTNYFFDIESNSLEPMLDRFSQFFTAPLFNPEFVEREKNAVHSEYLGKIKTDNRRFYAAIQQAFNPESSYAQFSVGNLDTLADRENQPVRDDLLRFFQQYYSANQMTLVVLGKEPLVTLKQWVTEKFSAIANHNTAHTVFTQPLLKKAQKAHRIDIQSLENKRELGLLFPLPATQAYYRNKPSLYLQSLLGHEGEGSLLQRLKHKGWADELSASPGFSDNAQESSLYLAINLTKKGLQHIDDVIDLCFQAIRRLQEDGVQARIFKEQQHMMRLRFRYQEQQGASHTVTKLAHDLHYYSPEDILQGPYLMEDFQKDVIQQLLAALNPDNVLIALNSNTVVDTDKLEPYYQVHYKISPMSAEQRHRWSQSGIDDALHLPAANPFIPDNLYLKTSKQLQTKPQPIETSAHFTVWHQLDNSFKVPRSSLYLAIHSPVANQSPRQNLLTRLLTEIVKKQLNSYAYPANLAGLYYSIYPTERGISLSLSGYDQKQGALLERILNALKNPEITTERFTVLKERFQQSLANATKQAPFHQVLSEIKRSIVERNWTPAQKIAALATIEQTDLNDFAQQFFKQVSLTLFVHGNQTAAETKEIADIVKQHFTFSTQKINVPPAGVLKLPQYSLNTRQLVIDNQDAALALYFQAPHKSIQSLAYEQLLGRIIGSYFFADLRTKQQLGYNLAAAAFTIKDVAGLLFILQSPVLSAPDIEQHIRAFIADFQRILKNLSEQELTTYKTGLITHLLEKDKNLHKRSARYWLEIDRKNDDFNTREQIATAVENINKTTLLQTFQEWLINHPRQFRSYSLGTKFNQQDFQDKALIIDTDAFKEQYETF